MKNYITMLPCALVACGLLSLGSSRAAAQSTYAPPYAISTLGGTLRTPGTADGTPGQFELPFGVAVDTAGNVYVGDTSGDTIRKITPGGAVSTLAGLPTVTGSADGTGAGARFNGPEGVAVDTAGNVYVADLSNATIRKITPSGGVTTLAGLAGTIGTADGTGTGARFDGPAGVAVDGSGNVYVADTYSDTIRKVTPAGAVTTIAGLPGVPGTLNGTAGGARFNQPSGIASDAAGNLYVADTGSDTIRKITPGGVVTTVAGAAGVQGSADGTGAAARFYLPVGIAVDANANLYVADTYNDTVRLVTSSGVVTTLAGQVGIAGTAGGTGIAAQFDLPYGIAVDATGVVYVADTLNTLVRKGMSSAVPIIGTQPLSQSAAAGATVALQVTATGALGYQWSLNGTIIPGATSATLSLPRIGTSQAGTYTVLVSNASGSVNSTGGVLTVSYDARLINLSARTGVAGTSNLLIGGFGISGSGTKVLLLRGVGPGLFTYFGLPGTLSNPQLTLFDSVPTAIVTNIGWANALTAGASTVSVSPQAATAGLMSTLGAFTIPGGSADSAMKVTAPTGGYTAQVSGVGGTSGVALMEVYDADTGSPPARLVNLSARSAVGVGGNILIGGFVITGSTAETVLIRGVGPGLTTFFGLGGTLVSPQLVLLDSTVSASIIASNSGWGTAPTTGPSTVQAGVVAATSAVIAEVGAFPVPSGSTDAAMVVTLPPGNYTAQLSGVGGSTGIGLIEVYEVP